MLKPRLVGDYILGGVVISYRYLKKGLNNGSSDSYARL